MADPRGKQQPAFTQAEIRFVRSTLRRLGVRHELDDAVGDVLLAVSEHLPDYAPSRPRWPWLYAFARFGSLNHHRQTRVRARRELGVPDVEALNMPHRGPDPWASAVTRNRLEILDRLLSELPPEQIEVLLLHDACGMTAAAIASTLSLPLGTVTTRLRVARRNIDAARRRIEAQLASHGESLTALPAFALLFDTVETSPGDADEPPSAPGVSAVTPPRVTAAPWMAAGIPALAGVVAVTVASASAHAAVRAGSADSAAASTSRDAVYREHREPAGRSQPGRGQSAGQRRPHVPGARRRPRSPRHAGEARSA